MNKPVLRAALLSSASLVLPVVLFPTTASAVTVCTGNNNFPLSRVDITCVENGTTVVATGTTEISTNVLAPPQGLSAVSALDMTVTLSPGSPTDNTILTNLISTPGIILNAAGDLILNAPDVNVTTQSPLSDAVNLTGATVTASLGDLWARDSGSDALQVASAGTIDITAGLIRSVDRGVTINGGAGAIDLTTGDVTGAIQYGIAIGGSGAINVDAGDVFGGLWGIRIQGGAGPIDVVADSVTAQDFSAQTGILISGTGTITVDAGPVQVSSQEDGRGIQINGGAGAISVTTQSVSTTGEDGDAIFLTGTGAVTLAANGPITTSGPLASGIIINAGSGPVSLTTSSVTTTGEDSDAVVITGGTVTGTIGDVFTDANNSTGVLVTATNNVDLTVGDVDFGGEFSDGVVITSTTGDINVDIGTVTNHAGGASNDGVNLSGAAITATIDEIDISTLGGVGLIVNASDDVDVTVGDVTNYDAGIRISAGANDVDLVCGNVTTRAPGANSSSVTINATGTVDLTCGNISTLTGASGEFAKSLDINGGAGAITATIGNVVQDSNVANAVEVSGTGAITLTTGNVTSDNYASSAIAITGGAGPIDLTCGNILVESQNNSGVTIAGTGAIDVTCGNLTGTWATTSAGSDVLLGITGGAGPITASVGNVSQSSGGSDAIVIGGTGPISLTTGNVVNSGTGGGEPARAVVINGGAGDVTLVTGNNSTAAMDSPAVTINATGTINVTAGVQTTALEDSDGLLINGGAGAISATVAGASTAGNESEGVQISGSGPINLSVTGPITTAGDSSRGILILGTGAITVAAGGAISTTGASSDGLRITGGAGAISATIGNVTTTGADSEGVDIATAGSVALTNSGLVRTSGTGSTGIAITGATTANVSCGNITTTGADSPAFDLSASGNTTVTCGTLSTAGANSDGINVVNSAGTTSVTGGTTTVSGAGSIGVDVATSGTGAVTVNTGIVNQTGTGAPAAVRVVASGAAPVTVNATGNVTSTSGAGVLAQSAGTAAVVVNSGVTVQGTTTGVQLAGTGGNTLTVNGTLRSSTTGNPAYIVTSGPLTLNLNATGTIVGPLAFTAGNDIFNNAANYTQSGVIDFGAGNDAFNNSGTFTQTAAVNFGDGNDTLTNTGTYNAVGTTDFGAGTDVVNNQASGTFRVTGGAATLANLETFNNAGIITMVDGAANDTLTLSGNYTGSGAGRLALDVVGTAAGNTADLLVVGGNIGGTTTIAPNFVSPVIDPDGVLIVDGGGTLGSNAFVIGTGANQGLIQYSLLFQGNNVLLASTADQSIFDLGVLGGMSQDIWYQSADAYLACATARRADFGKARSSSIELCAQLYGGSDRYGDGESTATVFGTSLAFNDRLKTNRRGAQVDVGFRTGGNFHVGLTGGYEHAKSSLTTATDVDIEGYAIGAYAQYGSELGLYAGLMVKRDDYEARIVNPVTIAATQVDGDSFGIDGEAGWRMNGLGALIDLNAGLSYVKSDLDDFTAGNIAVGSDSATSLRGRLGARLGWSASPGPYVGATLFHEFKGDDELTVGSGTLADSIERRSRGTWARLEAGLGGSGSGPLLALWTDLGDVKGWGLRAGFRF